jgi:hypothetical protein
MLDVSYLVPRPLRVGAVIFGLGAACFVGLALSKQDPNFYAAAIVPGFLALGFFLSTPKSFSLILREEGIELDGGELIHYADILGLRWAGRAIPMSSGLPAKSGIIDVLHTRGFTRIRGIHGCSSAQLYEFLYERLPIIGEDYYDPKLGDFVNAQTQIFGDDQIWTYTRRSTKNFKPPNLFRFRSFFLLLAGIALIIVGATDVVAKPWTGFGIFVFIVAFFLWVGSFAARVDATGKKIAEASLIITPAGLALSQGDSKGRLRWDEIATIDPPGAARRIGQNVMTNGIRINVAGATIVIADVYDSPIQVIHDRITSYWHSPV